MSAKQTINDKLQGSMATYLRCGGVVNNQIKKGLLLSLEWIKSPYILLFGGLALEWHDYCQSAQAIERCLMLSLIDQWQGSIAFCKRIIRGA